MRLVTTTKTRFGCRPVMPRFDLTIRWVRRPCPSTRLRLTPPTHRSANPALRMPPALSTSAMLVCQRRSTHRMSRYKRISTVTFMAAPRDLHFYNSPSNDSRTFPRPPSNSWITRWPHQEPFLQCSLPKLLPMIWLRPSSTSVSPPVALSIDPASRGLTRSCTAMGN